MESTSYVLSFRMVSFYFLTTGWIFDIVSLRENSIYQLIVYFVCDSASELERWALLPFLSFPALFVFLNLCYCLEPVPYFFACVGTFSGSFLFFSVPYFGLACDHRNSFLCLEEYQVRKRMYWIEIRTVLNLLYLRPMIPPKRFDISPPDWGMLRRWSMRSATP